MSDPRAKNIFSRRNFIRTGALSVAAFAVPHDAFALPEPPNSSPIRLGLASYTFRDFTRANLIRYMQQLQVSALNAKDVKDHLPTDPPPKPPR